MTAPHHAVSATPTISTQQEDKCFQYIKEVQRAEAVSQRTPFILSIISLKPEKIAFLAKDQFNEMGAAVARIAPPCSLTYRIRCVKIGIDTQFADGDWFVAEHMWPECITIVFNGQNLDLRRKPHYGKDIPADVTRAMKEGDNTLTIALTDSSEKCAHRYFVGLEAVEVTTLTKIKVAIPTIDEDTANQRVLSRIIVEDPDIEVIDPPITLDQTDPFTATIFEVPCSREALLARPMF